MRVEALKKLAAFSRSNGGHFSGFRHSLFYYDQELYCQVLMHSYNRSSTETTTTEANLSSAP